MYLLIDGHLCIRKVLSYLLLNFLLYFSKEVDVWNKHSHLQTVNSEHPCFISYFKSQTQMQIQCIWLQMVAICTQCLLSVLPCEPSPLTSDKGMDCRENPNILWAHIRGRTFLFRSQAHTAIEKKKSSCIQHNFIHVLMDRKKLIILLSKNMGNKGIYCVYCDTLPLIVLLIDILWVILEVHWSGVRVFEWIALKSLCI